MFGDSSQDVFSAVDFLRGKVISGGDSSLKGPSFSAKHELHL